MLNEFHVTAESYREAISDEASAGRIPMARLIWGYVPGHGWGFLRPWEAIAIFPEKGTLRGIGHRNRRHVRFWIRRLIPKRCWMHHRNHEFPVEGRYWRGVCWREGWIFPRLVMLDPDIIYTDDNAYEWDPNA